MFINIKNDGIYKSSDYGSTFTKLTINNNLSINAFSTYENYILACSTDGIYSSSDYGSTWIFTNSITDCSIICIGNNGFAIACTTNTIYVSTTNGKIWLNSSILITDNFCKKAIISNYGYALVLTNSNLLLTINYGYTNSDWKNFPSFLKASEIGDIAVSTNGLLVGFTNTNVNHDINTTSIYSYINSYKTFISTQTAFTTKGLLNNQITFPLITNNQINIQINQSTTPPNYYIFSHNSTPNHSFSSIPINPPFQNSYNYNFTNLQANTQYDFSFQAFYPNLTALLTQQIYTKSNPTNFYCDPSMVSDISINIAFNTCLNQPLAYNLFVQNKENINDYKNIIINSTTTSNPIIYTLNGLKNDTKYILTIDASYSDYKYIADNTLNITTKSTPTNISIQTIDYQSVDVSFNEPVNTKPSNFTLFVKDYQNIITQTIDNIPLNQTQNKGHKIDISGLTTNNSYNLVLRSNYENMQIYTPNISFNSTPIPTVYIYYKIDPIFNTYTIVTSINLPLTPNYFLLTIYYPDKNDISYNETTDYPAGLINTVYKFNDINYNPDGDTIYNNTYNIEVTAVYTKYIPIQYVSNRKSLIIAKTTGITFNNVVFDISHAEIPYFINITDIPNQYYIYFVNTMINNLSYVYNIPTTQSNLIDTSIFSNLYINSGTYKYYLTNPNGNIISDLYYGTLTNVSTIQINSINQKRNNNIGILLDIQYTILYTNTYEPYYTLYIVNTDPTINNSYSSTTYSKTDTSFNITVNIAGDYNIYITNYYRNGYFKSNIIPTTINILSDVSFNISDISYSYNWIRIPYKILSYIKDPYYTISISGSISEFNASSIIIPSANSSYANVTVPIPYDASSTFLVYANTGTYYYQITDGTTIFHPPNNSITLPTINNIVYNVSYTFNVTNFNFNVIFNSIVTYSPTYTLFLENINYSSVKYLSISTSLNPSFIDITNVCRSGNYRYYITNQYKKVVNNSVINTSYSTTQFIININIPNTISFPLVSYNFALANYYGIYMSYQTINISFQITSYDITPLNYTLYLINKNIPALDYSYSIIVPLNINYNTPNIYTSSYNFTEIYVNSGNYRCYIKDSTDMSYNNTTNITTSIISPTFSISNISNNLSNINGTVTILYPCYNSIYTFNAVSITQQDISYSSIYNASAIIQNSKTQYSNTNMFLISNIARNDTYKVYAIHSYNVNSVEILNTTTTISIPYQVTFNITKQTNTVKISYSIIGYNIIDINYNINIKNSSSTNIQTQKRILISSSNLNIGNSVNGIAEFNNLDSETYNCYVNFYNSNNIQVTDIIIQYSGDTNFKI
jgi:hypothetical protein